MFSLGVFFFLPFICHAAHFDGGSITYKIINNTNSTVSIMITQTYIYVYPTIYCNNSYIINQSPPLNMAGRNENGKYLNCTENCTTSGGYIPVSLNPYCTDYSSAMSVTIGQRSDIVNISIGSYFVVAFASNNWRTLTLSTSTSGGQAWSLACTIDLRLRANGNLNNPPVAAIISPIYIPVGIQQAIFIPTIDADNDEVRCRFANGSNECADVCPPASLPNGAILLSNCTLYITGANIGDWYAVAIMIEDFVDSTSVTPMSSVPVQFLINVRGNSSCPTRPLLTGPVSQTGACTGMQVGETYTIELVAENFCPNSTTINDISTLSFPIVMKTPIIQNTTSLWSVSLSWTPTASEVGSQVLCAVAIDSTNVQSNQYCMTFTVAEGSVPACPGDLQTTIEMTTYVTSEMTSMTETTISTSMTPSTSSSSTSLLWIAVLVAALALVLLSVCLCCCYYCCPCCSFKRRRKHPSQPESTEDTPNDTIRPSSSQSTKDIQLTIRSAPKETIKPHYTLALNRSPRIISSHMTLSELVTRNISRVSRI